MDLLEEKDNEYKCKETIFFLLSIVVDIRMSQIEYLPIKASRI